MHAITAAKQLLVADILHLSFNCLSIAPHQNII